jgi:L-seryl-tRNA(Ser) seleniumtransferase
MTPRRAIPAVGRVIGALGVSDLPHPLVAQLVRQKLALLRNRESIPPFDQIVRDLQSELMQIAQSRLQPVINGTGIIIHTNFGRAPLGPDAMCAMAEIGSAYNNLEYDLTTGARGKRAGFFAGAKPRR